MIKAVIFDWGGVMSPAGSPDELANNFAGKIGITPNEAGRLLALGASQLKRGRITEDEFWRLISKEHGSPLSADHKDVWIKPDKFAPIAAMTQLVADIKASGRKAAVLSNTFPASAAAIKDRGWYDPFDIVLVSSDEGIAKPDSEFYQTALQRLGVKADETLFIDDQQYCIDAAKALGIQTILASNRTETVRRIRAILNL